MQKGWYKIAHVIDMLQPGGAERVLLTQATLFSANGHQFDIITTVTPGKLAEQIPQGVNLYTLNRKWKYNPCKIIQLFLLLRQYEIIHIHSYHNFRYAQLALQLPGVRGKIFYQEHHGGYNVSNPASAEQKRLLKRVNFIAVSQDIAVWAVQQAGVPVDRISLLPNIVLKETICTDATVCEAATHLLITANFTPNKNILFAIDILHFARQETNQNLHLTIVGNINDEAYYNLVLQSIEQKKLSQAVTIRTDLLKIQPVLPRFDLAIHCSKYESGPLVLVEYMAQGLPFLTTNTGQVVQQIKEDLPEFIINEFDAATWCNRLLEVTGADKKILQKRMENCFYKYYSPDQYYTNCLNIYKRGS